MKLSETRYITGSTALNIPTPDGRQADWHAGAVWLTRNFFQNNVNMTGAVEALGDDGLWDATTVFESHGVYHKKNEPIFCATPERAIIDWAYSILKQGAKIYFTINDFLPEEFDLAKLAEY